MSKVIKNVKVDWAWSGDDYSLIGYNVAITPSTANPNTTSSVLAIATIKNGLKSFTFNNVVLDDAITYTAWVQAVYNGKDSSWVNTSNFTIADDGTATVETRVSNVANQWRHAQDPNKIDGGDIFAKSISATSINLYDGNFVIYNTSPSINAPSFSVSSTGDVNLSGNLKSFNYNATNKTGWSITQDGNAVLNQATVRGSLLLPNAGMTDQNIYRIWAGSSVPYTSWTTTISSASAIGAKTLTLTSVTGIIVGVNQLITIGTEQKMIVNLNGNIATLDSALINAYSNGTTVTLTLLAPFTVSQDGTVYAKKGNFGGVFTGTHDVGNIHITDTDPNSSPTGASFIMNTDNETRTVIRLQETSGFIDTKFTFGNDVDQYILIDNANNNFALNNNQLKISQFNNNLLINSHWITDTNGWTVDASGWVRDTSVRFNNYPSCKISRTGLGIDTQKFISSGKITISQGQNLVASVYAMSDNIAGIDGAVPYIDIAYYNSSDGLIGQVYPSMKPTANNVWQRFVTTLVAPANTAYAKMHLIMNRNGNLWVACPQLELGNTPTSWGINITELKDVTFPNRVDNYYMQFKGNNYNFDIKSDNTFYLQSNSTATTDFKFAKESTSNAVSVLVDGSLEINNLLKMGKLTVQKKTDAGNQGIDFIFS